MRGFRARVRKRHVLLLAAVGGLVALIAAGMAFGLGGGGNSPESLEAELARSYRAPQSRSVDIVYRERQFTCARTDTGCARSYLTSITSDYGPRASLTILRRLQAEGRLDLSVNDHDLAHAVGRKTAERFGANPRSFELCTNVFNYGCPHGFFEYVLGRTDTPRDAATVICRSQRKGGTPISEFSCYHGVGHGVLMARAYDLQESLDVCDALGGDVAREACWQGVFMENVNAAMRNEAEKGVFSRSTPLAPCTRVAQRYRYQCYINHAGWLMTVAGNDTSRATRYCLAAARRDVSACMQSIGLMVTNPVWQKNLSRDFGRRPYAQVAWSLCTQFPFRHRRDCLAGGVDNAMNFDRLDLRRVRAFCELTGSLERACFRQVGINVRRQASSAGVARATCTLLAPAHAQACREGAAV